MANTLDRLSKLIAQADNASTEAERIAYMERAEKLSAEINVELAVARMHAIDKTKREAPIADFAIRINSYSARPIHRTAMMDLFIAIAGPHDVELLIGRDNFTVFCYGYPSDIEVVRTLFGMLSLKMVSEADAAIKRGEQKYVIDEAHRKIGIDGRVYRRNFYEGFIKTVSGRLWQHRYDAARAVDESSHGSGTLALRDKTVEINSFFKESTEHMSLRGTHRGLDNSDTSASDAVRHGNAAGKRADLGLHDKDVAGSTRLPLGN